MLRRMDSMANEEKDLLIVQPDSLTDSIDSPSVNFIQHHLSGVHGAFTDIQPVFDREADRFVSQDFRSIIYIPESSELNKARDSFVATFKIYEAKEKTGTDIWSQGSWESVLFEMDHALKKYQGKQKQKVTKCLYLCQEHQNSVRHWLRLLPSDSWQGSLLCGGVKILCNAAARLGDIRLEVADAIGQIPIAINYVCRLKEVYSGDEFHRYMEKVITAALSVLESCLKWFMIPSSKKFMSAVIKGDNYMAELDRRRKTLGSICEEIKLRDSAENSVATNRTQQVAYASYLKLEQLENRSIENGKRNETAEKHVLNLLRQCLESHEQVVLMLRRMARERQALEEGECAIQRREAAIVRKERRTFLKRLRYSSSTTLAQLETTLRNGLSFSEEQKDRADWILRCRELKHWLAAGHSRVLVINAREPVYETDSTVSFFSALLLSTLRDIKPMPTILYWLCSRNTDRNVQSMLKTFIGQLLDTNSAAEDLSPPDGESELYFEDLVQHLRRYICAQMKESPVYCIMDSVSCYEDRDREDDLLYLCKEISKITQMEESPPHPFKILATSPTLSTCFGSVSRGNREILTVPEVIDRPGCYSSQSALASRSQS